MLKTDPHFALNNFEGTLDFLLCLIQKAEIDIYEVPIQSLIQQFVGHSNETALDAGAEFIRNTAYLIWLKSKTLLPADELDPPIFEEPFEDPRFEIIHHLIDYCHFKQTAKELVSRQAQQEGRYFRGIDLPEHKKPLGIDHVSLEELTQLFQQMMIKAVQNHALIEEENWRVSDKIRFLRSLLKEPLGTSFETLILNSTSRAEMIVIFLAILELMKTGEMRVGREQHSRIIMLYPRTSDE